MITAAICATPRVGATALLRSLETAIPGAAEYPDAVESAGVYLTMIHWQQMPVDIDGRYIYVHREDRLDQAISWAVGAATGRFHVGQPKKADAGSLDREAVHRSLAAIDAQNEAWHQWLTGKPTLTLCYETDIKPDAAAAARRVLDWLGIDGDPQAPNLKPVDVRVKRAWRKAWEDTNP
jgi:LPS sulfotransferase NodH